MTDIAMPTLVDDGAASAYRRDGFVHGGPLLEPDRVAELLDELDRVVAEAGAGGRQPIFFTNLSGDESAPVWQIVDIWTVSEAFERLLFEPKLAGDAARLTGATDLRVWHDQIQHKPPAAGGANHWHQDLPYWPNLRGGQQLTAWVALDDADESNGAMVMVPGSHAWGDRIAYLEGLDGIDGAPDSFEGQPVEVVSRPVRAGEVHYHHCLTWHGSPPNRSARHRRAIAIHFMTGDTTFVPGSIHPMAAHVESAPGQPLRGSLFPVVTPPAT